MLEELPTSIPTESMREMWQQIKEKAGNRQEEWQERKKQMKEMWKDLKQRAGEHKEEFKKMWKENKGSWRNKAEEKWQKYKTMTAEQLEQAKQEIDALQEKLGANVPEKPWKEMKNMRSKVKDMIIALKEAFKVKLRQLKKQGGLEPIEEEGEEEVPEEGTEVPTYIEEPYTEEPSTEEPFTEEPFTEEPFTDEPATAEPFTDEPFTDEPELTFPSTTEEIAYTSEPSEIPTFATEVLPTEYSEEDIDGNENWSDVDQEVLNDEQQTPEESEEEEDEEDEDEVAEGEILPEEPVEGEGGLVDIPSEEEEADDDDDDEQEEEDDDDEGAMEETQTQENTSPMKEVLSNMMSERRNRKMKQWMKRGQAMKTNFKKAWKNWFKKRGQNSRREP
ncbi:uncharacterized protein LOC144640345 [Oculina patagonica]